MIGRDRLHEILDGARPGDRVARVVQVALVVLIVANVIALVLESVAPIAAVALPWFERFERFSVAVFTLEYVLRLWTCVAVPRFREPWRGRLRYALSPLGLVDLLAILPSYLPWLGIDLRVVRLLRLLRLLRVLKLGRYSVALQTLGDVLRQKRSELGALAFVLLLMLTLVSSLMYYLENDAQPRQFSSIPAAMWWGIVTLTTIGYGDMAPITDAGRVLGAFVAALGIGMFALPAGLLGAAFTEELNKRRRAEQPHCPHCGKSPAEPGT